MIRLFLSSCMLLCGIATAHAQFRIDMGTAVAFTNELTDSYTATDVLTGASGPYRVTRSGSIGIGFAPYPKYHLLSNKIFSLSVGAPLAAGYGIIDNSLASFEESSGVQLAYEASVAADINFGIPNPKKRDDKFGAALGAGFGVQRAGLKLDGPGEIEGLVLRPRLNDQSSALGFLVHGSVMAGRFGFPIGARIAYRKSVDPDRLNFWTVGLFYPL